MLSHFEKTCTTPRFLFPGLALPSLTVGYSPLAKPSLPCNPPASVPLPFINPSPIISHPSPQTTPFPRLPHQPFQSLIPHTPPSSLRPPQNLHSQPLPRDNHKQTTPQIPIATSANLHSIPTCTGSRSRKTIALPNRKVSRGSNR